MMGLDPRELRDLKAQLLLCDAPIVVFDLDLTEDTLAIPAPGRLVLRPAGFLYQLGKVGPVPGCPVCPPRVPVDWHRWRWGF